MNRIELACYGLIASALVLGAAVLIQADRRFESAAQAQFVVKDDITTILSAPFDRGQDIIYVLDGKNERLMAYQLDPNKNVVEVLDTMNIAEQIGKVLEQPAARGGR